MAPFIAHYWVGSVHAVNLDNLSENHLGSELLRLRAKGLASFLCINSIKANLHWLHISQHGYGVTVCYTDHFARPAPCKAGVPD